MNVNRQESATLTYLAVEPDGYDPSRSYPMIVLLHGYGAHMGDLAGLSQAIDSSGYLYICPNAPLPLEIGMGAMGYSWTPPGSGGDTEEGDEAERLLVTFLDEVTEKFGVERDQVVLGGFSQGGMMTYRCGLTATEPYRGLVVLSGRVPDAEVLKPRLAAARPQPLFVAHGTEDSMISVDHARESRRFLEGEGYSPAYHEYPMGHEINQQVLDDLVPWLHEVLPPA